MFILYHYSPTLVGAVHFIIFFSASTLLHAIQLARFQAWFMLPVILGGICEYLPSNFSISFFNDQHVAVELTAYICRSISHSSPQSLTPFIISSILALVAPALFAATIYMTLGRIMRLLHAEHHSLIHVQRLTKTFVLFDVLSFFMQSGGGGLQAAKKHQSRHIGQILVLVALFLQVIVFGLFVVVAAVFHKRLSRQPTPKSQGSLPWKRHMAGLYTTSGLILLRNVIKIVEYIQGYDGYINHHEWFLYVFDAVPMFAVMVVMGIVYAPLLLVQGKKKTSVGEVMEI